MSFWDLGLGDLATGVMGYFGQQQTNDQNVMLANQSNAFNASQAAANRDFQTNMRATQYQTAVKDMQAAGLNPMLAYSQGGAGTPSGSSASSVSPARVESPSAAGVNAAYTASRTRGEQQQIRIKQPLETGADMVDKGLRSIKDAVLPLSESIAGLVKKVEDRLSGASLSSAGAAAVEKVADTAKSTAIGIVDAIGQSAPARALSGAVSSAVDAKDAVVAGAKSVRDAAASGWQQGKSLPRDETPREAAKRTGRRLGTLGLKGRTYFAPEYRPGE